MRVCPHSSLSDFRGGTHIWGGTDLRSKLASSTEAELRVFQASLQTTKDATALDLQKNVFKK
jgi:hypothetical protein